MILDGKKIIDLVLNSKQMEGMKCLRNTKFLKILFDGGIRSGKTLLIWSWMLARAIVYPGSVQIIIRKETKQHTRSTWGPNNTIGKYMRLVFDKAGLKSLYNLRQTEKQVHLWNGSEIRLEGCATPEDVGKVLGSEYITMWFNEATDIDYEVVTTLWGRCVQKCYVHPEVAGRVPWFPRLANPQIIFDTNPKGKRHWLYKVGVLHIDPIEGGAIADPEKWGRVGGWEPHVNKANINQDMLEGMSGVAAKRALHGEWCDNEGVVYPEFNEDVHICRDCKGTSPCPKIWSVKGALRAKYLCRSIDFGFNDPTTCIYGAVFGSQVLIYRSYYQKNKIMSEHAKEIKEGEFLNEFFKWTVVDHDPDHAEVLRRAGIPNRNAHKDNPRTAGINRVRKRLLVDADGHTGLMVCQHCLPVIEEFVSYLMDPKKDEPEDDKNDHTMDAIRYMIAEIDGKRRSQAFIV